MWGGCFVGLLAPRPRQHGMLHPKLCLTAQEKSSRKRKRNNAFSSVTPVFLFVIASALREAHDGSGPATAGVWGWHQPPHKSILTLLSKIICAGLMPARASLGMQHPMLPGAWGEQPHKTNPPPPKTSAPVSQTFQAVFSAFSAPVLCPQGHHLGLNALRLRGDMGAA